MQPSQLNSLVIPPTGSQNPATLWKAATIPARIVVNNLGPNLVLLAHDPGTLTNSPVFANTYRLPASSEVVIVLAPHQGLFAVAVGVGGAVSIAVSEALPII
jgi:hypothetical protein